ncbi:MAG: hypothetical protein DRN47_03605 [Candidatus Wolframiiraptor sp.]|nr:MAG: hypothetical protein DRN47_03605 [Candidatus Wolframiiraptor sp.]
MRAFLIGNILFPKENAEKLHMVLHKSEKRSCQEPGPNLPLTPLFPLEASITAGAPFSVRKIKWSVALTLLF